MNCKPGDLAYIVKSGRPETIGVIVEVLEPLIHGSTPMWRVRALRPVKKYSGEFGCEGNIEDDRLRPISGVPVNDEVTDDIKEPA
ncbi:hypothetical protein [Paraburkholderia phenoliruptrix]|uniref:hypothetical protein n=1 Tax=Paraburkholderia phenoliruptrix TaxID=252970 RepID=UPI002863FEC3|nr:hypothetical protein [Paraburkholderia phenoliruptrix]MDR6393038.1 hypothetical protein [Paraburkholderia phenoliruptrix]